MSNKYLPHLHIIPEDDANRQLANGFLLDTSKINMRQIDVLANAGGWRNAVSKIPSSQLDRFPERRLLLLIDFDGDVASRKSTILNEVPTEVRERVFLIGVSSEPEALKKALGQLSYERIGKVLFAECADESHLHWGDALLAHNKDELTRLKSSVKSLIFP